MSNPFCVSICLLLELFVRPLGEADPAPELSATALHKLSLWLFREVSAYERASLSLLPKLALKGLTARLAHVLGSRGGEALEATNWLARRLDQLCESPDAVVDALDCIKRLLATPARAKNSPMSAAARAGGARSTHLDPKSVFGLFVRRTVLTCSRDHFDGIARLFDQLCAYVRPSGSAQIGFLSPRQLQLYLEERILAVSHSTGDASFEEVEAELAILLELHPELPRAHFLRYVNCVHQRGPFI